MEKPKETHTLLGFSTYDCLLKYRANIIASIIFIAAVVTLALVVVFVLQNQNQNTTPFYQQIATSTILAHLNSLQNIANEEGSRAIITGYNESVKWLLYELSKIDCEMGSQDFIAPSFVENTPASLKRIDINLQYQVGVDMQGLRYGGDGYHNLTRNVTAINGLGCDLNDFEGFTSGNIALIKIGNCSLFMKAKNANLSSASAVILYNSESSRQLSTGRVIDIPWFEGDQFIRIPVVAVTYSVGTSLIFYNGLVHLETNTTIYETSTKNVWCDTKNGDPENTIVIGSHLDSVLAGPGINDNGSGSSTVLALLKLWYASGLTPKNRLRFAWWGAEEEGLLGSRNYMRYVNKTDELKEIVLGINLDMVGSPNYIPFIGIYPNDPTIPVSSKNGSNMITSIFTSFYDNILKQSYEYIYMTAGSDHFAFLEVGIPAGRIHSGAAQIKTEEQRQKYEGVANAQADTCYHLSCDTINNINTVALSDLSQATAYVLQQVALEENLKQKLQGYSNTGNYFSVYSDEFVE